MPYKLGPFNIDHPFILAPMAGITNSPYRRLMKRMRSALVVSELVSANGIEFAGEKTLELLRFEEEERLVGLQIFGETSELLCKASRKVEEMGADFVDLNLGCPVPKIVKKGAGSALCRNPVALGEILSAMVRAVKIPVTIKIRTGWDESTKNLHEVIRVASDAGISWVAIHGRTRAQGYSGLADWDLIGEAKARSSMPIIGNGDLTTPELAVERLRTYGLDGVMIGRGALRNPFIFEQAERLWRNEGYGAPELDRYLALLGEQRGLLAEHFAPRQAAIHAKKFLAWYSAGFPGCHSFRQKVFQTEDVDALWGDAETFFRSSFGARDLSFMAQPFLMGGHG